MKRIIALLLTISILSVTILSASAETISADSNVVIVHDQEKNERIDEFFAIRSQLELDYEENRDLIERIDIELALLGVETITYGEVLQKLGVDAAPNVSIGTMVATDWTSRRTVVTYNGQQYELQIIEGVPADDGTMNSPLEGLSAEVSYQAAGRTAGAIEIAKVLGVTAMGADPYVGSVLTIATTIYDMLKAADASLTTSTVMNNVEGTALLSMTTHMKYIFVKGYGSSDQYQILCYLGNYVSYKFVTTTYYDIPGDGDPEPVPVYYESSRDSANSAYYSDYTRAAYNYYAARNNLINDMLFNFTVTHIRVKIFQNESRFPVPIGDAPIICEAC